MQMEVVYFYLPYNINGFSQIFLELLAGYRTEAVELSNK